MTPKEWYKEKLRNVLQYCVNNKLGEYESENYALSEMNKVLPDFLNKFPGTSKTDAALCILQCLPEVIQEFCNYKVNNQYLN